MASFKIVDVELHHFLGFIKPRIKNLKVNFVEMLQILNSTNGSGKTEFLKENSPFPINKDIFAKDGYKKIRIEKDGLIYSLYSNHKKNSFIIESTNEELNRGGTISTQEELIKLHLGITRPIWNMITGRNKFTQLDKNARRQWMEIISGLDFEYAFSVYKEIKTAISHHKGSVKVTSEHLISESSKQLDSLEIKCLKKEQKGLSELITEVLKNSDPNNSANIQPLVNQVKSTEKTFNSLLHEYLLQRSRKKRVKPIENKPISVEDIKLELQRIKDSLSVNGRNIENLTLELAELNQLKEKLMRTDGYTLDTVNKKIAELHLELTGLNLKISDEKLVCVVNNWNQTELTKAVEFNRRLQSKLHELFSDWSEDVVAYPHTHDQQQKILKNKQILRQRIIKGNSVVNRCELKLKHFRECEKTVCPKCEHNFKVGLESVTEDSLVKQLTSSERLLAELMEEEKILDAKYNDFNRVDLFLTSLKEQVLTLNNPFLNYFNTVNFQELNKETLLGVVETIILNSDYLFKVVDLNKTIAQLMTIQTELKTQENLINLDQLTDKHKSLLVKIENERLIKSTTEAKGRQLKEYGIYLTKTLQLQSDLLSKGAELHESNIQLIKALEFSVEQDIISEAQKRVGITSKLISEQQALEATLASMKKQISSSKNKLLELTILEKALNPSVGIIAKQMGGYTKAFTQQLSSMIGRLWGYELEVLPPTIEGSKGMDYKFPFIVEGNVESPVPDISEGSKSQVAGFNLGVMLATRIALGMEQMPLVLDEVSDGFDTTHNEKLADFLKELLEECGCTNMFLVHHDAAIRNSLGQHDMIVFDSSQVIINGEYNTNVEMQYLS